MMRRSLPKKVHLRVCPQLTRQETQRLQARAKADLRSIADYVARLIEQDLRECNGGGRGVRGAGPDDRRAAYEIQITLTVEQRKRIEAEAQREGRSLSNYVAKVIVEALARR